MKKTLFTFLIIYSNYALSLFGPDVEIESFLEISLGNNLEEVKYRYQEPTQENVVNGFKTVIYNYKNGIEHNFVLKQNKVKAILCRNQQKNSGCQIKVLNGKYTKISDENSSDKYEDYIYVNIGVKEASINDFLGKPSLSKIENNFKQVFYKKHNLFINYKSGFVDAVGIGVEKSLKFYQSQIYSMQNVADLIKEKEDQEKFDKEMRKMIADQEKINAKAEKRKQYELDSSNELYGANKYIRLGESLKDIQARFKNIKKIDGYYWIQTSDSSFRNKYEYVDGQLQKKEPGPQPLDFYFYLNSSNQIKEVGYFCSNLLKGEYLTDGKFFNQQKIRDDGNIFSSNSIYDNKKHGVGCGLNISQLEEELLDFKVYCHADGQRLYSTNKFKKYSSNTQNFYEFFTFNNEVDIVVLTSEKNIPPGFGACN